MDTFLKMPLRDSRLRKIALLVAQLAIALLAGVSTCGYGANSSDSLALSTEQFYADPNSLASVWVRTHPNDSRAREIAARIATKPAARWFGDWSGEVQTSVSRYVMAAAAANRTPILVAYNIPKRDCRQYSAGGASSAAAYQRWITSFTAGIGISNAIVILEPDALAQIDCLPLQEQAERLELLNYAAVQLRAHAPNARVYLDIGHSGWLSAQVATARLLGAGIEHVRGFSLNVSNFGTTTANTAYGQSISALLKISGLAKTFIVDTSRNGNGPLAKLWCDPPGRRIGEISSAKPANTNLEMTLWIKNPGVADGCAAPAGTFVADLAFKLIEGM